jgi:enoyl-CoA hydratase/carnithine racemase
MDQGLDFTGLDMSAAPTPKGLDKIYKEAKDLLSNLLDIEVPIIGAVNGEAYIHAELILLSDIVIASHYARYLLPTGEEMDTYEAWNLGLVAEIVPHKKLLDRAWELARNLCTKADMTLRYSRVALTLELKRRMLNDLGYGSAFQGMATLGRVSG